MHKIYEHLYMHLESIALFRISSFLMPYLHYIHLYVCTVFIALISISLSLSLSLSFFYHYHYHYDYHFYFHCHCHNHYPYACTAFIALFSISLSFPWALSCTKLQSLQKTLLRNFGIVGIIMSMFFSFFAKLYIILHACPHHFKPLHRVVNSGGRWQWSLVWTFSQYMHIWANLNFQ